MMSKHSFRARLEGGRVLVADEHGDPVQVDFAGTSDEKTVYAHVPGVGFIGGWTVSSRRRSSSKRPFSDLVPSINAGRVYLDMNDMPGGSD